MDLDLALGGIDFDDGKAAFAFTFGQQRGLGRFGRGVFKEGKGVGAEAHDAGKANGARGRLGDELAANEQQRERNEGLETARESRPGTKVSQCHDVTRRQSETAVQENLMISHERRAACNERARD